MAIISFGDTKEEIWLVARWVFHGLIARMMLLSDDAEVRAKLEIALAVDALLFSDLAKDLSVKIAPTLRQAVDDAISGAYKVDVEGRVLDEASQAQFRRAVGELKRMMERHLGG